MRVFEDSNRAPMRGNPCAMTPTKRRECDAMVTTFLRITASGDTLLRIIRQAPLLTGVEPEIVGVDD